MMRMYEALLKDAGYDVTVQPVESRELYAPELVSGNIDVVPEYAATITEYLNLEENGPDAEVLASPDAEATVEQLRALAEPRGLRALEPAEAANQNAFFVKQDFAEQGIVKFGEVAKGRGRKPSISAEKIAEIVQVTHADSDGKVCER